MPDLSTKHIFPPLLSVRAVDVGTPLSLRFDQTPIPDRSNGIGVPGQERAGASKTA